MSTQKELAKLAGVSAGTVSNVISGTKRVSDATRQKVLEAIRTLDYSPNLIARSLRTNRTNTLGIVIPEITVPFFPKLIRGAESAARDHGYFLIVADSNADMALEFELISLLRSQRVDGILLATSASNWGQDERLTAFNSPPPIVCVDRLVDGLDIDSVSVDNRAAAEMGVAHLLSMGHKEIAIITGPQNLKNEQERLSGYHHALQASGISARDSLLLASSFDRNEIERACLEGVVRSERRPSALFTTNAVVALEALRSIYAAGLRIPDDIAFATFDEIASADFFQPAITTIVQPIFEMGCRAVEVLLDRIAQGGALEPPKRIYLPSTLVVRASSSLPHRSVGSKAMNR
jgi:DNA-binding LacI/PurR family transcriptional regulator